MSTRQGLSFPLPTAVAIPVTSLQISKKNSGFLFILENSSKSPTSKPDKDHTGEQAKRSILLMTAKTNTLSKILEMKATAYFIL